MRFQIAFVLGADNLGEDGLDHLQGRIARGYLTIVTERPELGGRGSADRRSCGRAWSGRGGRPSRAVTAQDFLTEPLAG